MSSFNLCCMTTIGIGLKFFSFVSYAELYKQILKFKYLAIGRRNLKDDNDLYRI